MSTLVQTPRRRAWRVALLVVAGALLAGCAAPPPVAPVGPQAFDEAVVQASEALAAQVRQQPLFSLNFSRQTIVIDPMLDASSGQQTATTLRLEQRVAQRLGDGRMNAEVLPFRQDSLARARYLVTGTLARVRDAAAPTLALNLAMTDLKSGSVVAQTKALVRDEGLDHTPERYYVDSPLMIRDRAVEGYVTTTASTVGTPADPEYLKRLSVAAMFDEATHLYNAGQYQQSLERYDAARATDGGEQLRILNGLYITYARLGRNADADEAFGKLAAYGVANDQLRVKFLFNPGTTTFWSDPSVSGAYGMWLRQIAKASIDAKACMRVIGHTSHTGTEPYNDALSMQRASAIRQRLVTESAALADRLQPAGRGWRDNIVGSGTDDAVDALDRRVEFRVVPCAG